MITLKDFILESFSDTVLTEFYKFAKSLSDNDSKTLLNTLRIGNERFDLHKGNSDSLINLSNCTRQEIQGLLSGDINHKQSSNSYNEFTTQFYIFKIQYNDLTLFGSCYLGTWDKRFKECTMLLPVALIENPHIETFVNPSVGCTKLGKFIKQGAKITAYSYYAKGNPQYNEIMRLRQERAKNNVFTDNKAFCDFYKSETLKRAVTKMVDNIKTYAPDFNKIFEEVKAEYEEIKAMAEKISKFGIKLSTYELRRVDDAFLTVLKDFNHPDLYNPQRARDEMFLQDVKQLRSEIKNLKAQMKDDIDV